MAQNKELLKDVIAGDTLDAEKIARKYETSSRFRKIPGKLGFTVALIAVLMSVFHLLTAALVTMNVMQHRALHLTFAIVLIFLLYPATKKSIKTRPSIPDVIFAVAGLVSVGYLVVMYETIAMRGLTVTKLDLIMGGISMVLLLEAARRSVGYQIPLIAIIFLVYAYFGPYLPGGLAHRGFSLRVIVERMYLGNEGIFGIPLGVSATYVFLFVLLGSFLSGTGMTGLFTNAAIGLAGHRPGGPAKVSILSSGFFGMINGSAVGNVATTGVFTIPLMEEVGYSKRFSAGVEAVASTGGQIMPPIMGAAAFVMAEFLGIPYTKVIIVAIVPAMLYYVALWFMVHYEAKKTGLHGLPRDQIPSLLPIFKQRGHLILPIILLLVMLFKRYTPVYAAFFAIIATFVVGMVRKETRMDMRALWTALETGAKGAIFIAIATAVVGYVVGIVSLTGIGLKIANLIIVAAKGGLFRTLFFTMIACIILGMGLPTTACYIVTVIVAAPALVQLGVEPIVAHLFVLYFSIMSNITPPVAMASYTAAGIANANPTKVSWVAFQLGIAGFLVPFLFVYSPRMLLQQDDPLKTAFAIVVALFGVFALGTSIIGFWKRRLILPERILMFGVSILLMLGGLVPVLIGGGGMLLIWILQLRESKPLTS